MEGAVLPTPSQTVGPFFNIGLPGVDAELVSRDAEGAIRVGGVVYDGEGGVVPDALLEIWQANRSGRYDHPDDPRDDLPLDEGFRGFGRAETGKDGEYGFVTVKPGPVPAPGGARQAPHILVSVFARGLLKHVSTRIYFEDEAEANEADPVLSSVEADRRETLVATADGAGGYRFDIHLQNPVETVFFDI